MTDSMLPILRQMHEADARGQAGLLLSMPLAVILKYAEPLRAACRRTGLEAGRAYVDAFVAAMLAVRDRGGRFVTRDEQDLVRLTDKLATVAAGPPPSIEI